MAVSKRDLESVHHGMDLEEELDLHVRRWRLRTWVSAAVFILMVLAALGLFGGGPLSSTTVSASGNTLEYERFARFGNEVSMAFQVGPDVNAISVPLEYFKVFKLDRVVPQPQGQRVQDGRILFTFDSAGALTARFYLVPRDFGFVRTNVTINGRSLPVTQFVYP